MFVLRAGFSSSRIEYIKDIGQFLLRNLRCRMVRALAESFCRFLNIAHLSAAALPYSWYFQEQQQHLPHWEGGSMARINTGWHRLHRA